jgi:hypothetical protein
MCDQNAPPQAPAPDILSRVLSIRSTPAEADVVGEAALQTGLSLSQFGRQILLHASVQIVEGS